MLRMLPGGSKATKEGFLVSERRPGSSDGMPDGRADVRGPVRVHRKAAKTPVREADRGPAWPNLMVKSQHPTSLSTTFGSTVRSCRHFLLLGGVSGPQSKKVRQLRTVEPKVPESTVGCGNSQSSTPYSTLGRFWLHRTKLSAVFAPWRRWRAGEHKSQTASYGGAKSGLKYWRGWNFAAKTSVREAARG